MDNFKSNLLSAFAWFFGVIFIIGALAIGSDEGGIIAALLMLIGGLLLLPPVKRMILKSKPNLSTGKITALGSILIVIAYAFLLSNEDIQQNNAVDEQVLSDIPDNGSVDTSQELEEQIVEEEVVSIDDGFINPEEDGYYEDGYNPQPYDTPNTEVVESKRSKLPNPFIDFSGSIKSVDYTPIITLVSRNKEPLYIYDIIVNDGISCEIYGDKSSRNGILNFGEKIDLYIVNCSQDQVVEVKVITKKGYNTFTFQ